MIEFDSFSKSFGRKKVHKNICFKANEGECLGLIGGSGVGKSVILRSIIGLEKPDTGHIFIDGDDITLKKESEMISVRKKVAYVFQNGALFDSMCVFDNLAYPLREHTDLSERQIAKRILNLLEEFGLKGGHLLFPSELSGGMQKRVGLARSIILNPKVVLYDEPTAGLDPFNTLKIQEVILKLKARGVTSIFVTHDMPSVFAVCDRVALIQHGEIVEIIPTPQINKNEDTEISKFIQGKIA